MTAGIDDGSSIAAGFEAFDQAVLARVASAETQFGFDLINARSPVARIRIAGGKVKRLFRVMEWEELLAG